MALPLSTAKQLSSGSPKAKVLSEYAGKASPVKTKPFNGATNRRRTKKASK